MSNDGRLHQFTPAPPTSPGHIPQQTRMRGTCAAILLTVPATAAFAIGGAAHAPSMTASSRAAVHAIAAPPKSEVEKASFDTSIAEVPKCPITQWDSQGIDLASVDTSSSRTLPVEVRADPSMTEAEFIESQRESLLAQLEQGGALWLRGFKLMKSKEGFEQFYTLLGLDPCQDPLASVGARAVVSKKGAMYEAVNKPSRAKFFVGMHNESTFKRTNRLGAFVCFKQAETGGEFLLLDCRKVLAEMDPAVRARMYEKGVRFSNAELPFFDFLRQAGPLKEVSYEGKGVAAWDASQHALQHALPHALRHALQHAARPHRA